MEETETPTGKEIFNEIKKESVEPVEENNSGKETKEILSTEKENNIGKGVEDQLNEYKLSKISCEHIRKEESFFSQ